MAGFAGWLGWAEIATALQVVGVGVATVATFLAAAAIRDRAEPRARLKVRLRTPHRPRR
ncbi:MAG TPA: hypothetical protein VEY95_05115 [Azospirillaceae bacterium]|nr:hypothetical protein [Azospirillaceae bacterium]